jgi:uncharacterized membrane protein
VNTVLWFVQLLLALTMLALGLLKLTRPRATLLRAVPWAEDYPQPVVRAVGALEVLCAIGLVLPGAVGTATGPLVAAAVGTALVGLAGVVTDLLRGEKTRIAAPAAVLAGAALVALGRLGPWPLT